MILALILGALYASAAEELTEEAQPQHCNCTEFALLQSEDVPTDITPTFPTTSFTCWGRYDGYYADIEVDCTIFHYCQTWYFPTGLNETVKWDFACPQSTIFNQKVLSCTPPNISFDCQESPNYYWVNYNLTSGTTTSTPPSTAFTIPIPNVGQQLIVGPQSGTFPATDSDFVESTTSPDSAQSPVPWNVEQTIIFPTHSDGTEFEQSAAFSDASRIPKDFAESAQPFPEFFQHQLHQPPAVTDSHDSSFPKSGSDRPPGEVVSGGNDSEKINFPI